MAWAAGGAAYTSEMPPPPPDSLAFEDVVMDFVGRRLSRGGIVQTLEPKAFSVLSLLAGSP